VPVVQGMPSSPSLAPALAPPAQPKRHSMPIGSGLPGPAAGLSTPAPLTRPLNIAQQSFLRHSIETPTEPLVLEPLRASKQVKERFEWGEVEEESKARKRGAVRRLRALIERFERW